VCVRRGVGNLDTFECIATKFDVRKFSQQEVPSEIKFKVLEAARMTGTALNTQHWRFILVDSKEGMKRLAQGSTSGQWVAGANFAVIVLTNPERRFHAIDAGRAVQDMQLAAWNFGVASGVFTGTNEEMRTDFNIPRDLQPTIVAGFGYPARKVPGKKNRLPQSELAYHEKYGNPI
jgi:nitroreductase